jgi:hypothetical protein
MASLSDGRGGIAGASLRYALPSRDEGVTVLEASLQ